MGCYIISDVYERYVEKDTSSDVTAWKVNKPIKRASSTHTLRIVCHEAGKIVWSTDGWISKEEERLLPTGLGVYYHDFGADLLKAGTTLTFTFRYNNGRWEGKDYEVAVVGGNEGL